MNVNTKKEIEKIKKKAVPILKSHGINRAGLFGSIVRGEMDEESDIDIYVELPEDKHFGLEFFQIIRELKNILGREVDLVECSGEPPIKKEILKQEVRIL